MVSDLETTVRWAHRANIEKYRRILKTHLTVEERRFVERRIAEEQAALRQPAGGVPTIAKPDDDAHGEIS